MERIAIECKGLFYQNKNVNLEDIHFTLHSNELLLVLSNNHLNLRAFLKCLLGLYEPDNGKIKYFNHPLKEIQYILNFVGYFSTNGKLYPQMKVLDYLKYETSFYVGQYIDEINQYLNYFCIDPKAKIKNLDEDSINIVKFINAIIIEPQILFLDGFFETNLINNQKIIDTLYKLKDNGTAILATSTTLNGIPYQNQVLFLNNGRISSDNQALLKANGHLISYTELEAFTLKDSLIQGYHKENQQVTFIYTGNQDTLINKLSKTPITNLEIKPVTLADILKEEK